jgi:hypothetical protein
MASVAPCGELERPSLQSFLFELLSFSLPFLSLRPASPFYNSVTTTNNCNNAQSVQTTAELLNYPTTRCDIVIDSHFRPKAASSKLLRRIYQLVMDDHQDDSPMQYSYNGCSASSQRGHLTTRAWNQDAAESRSPEKNGLAGEFRADPKLCPRSPVSPNFFFRQLTVWPKKVDTKFWSIESS